MPYLPQSPGTTREAEEIIFAAYRRMSGGEKVRRQGALNASLERIAVAFLRQRFPGESERERKRRLAARRLGPELMQRVMRLECTQAPAR